MAWLECTIQLTRRIYRHEEDDTKLRRLIRPIEYCMDGVDTVVVERYSD